ncbi:MAG: hypothetical protein ACN4GF_04990 [Lentimonas sp.]
MKNLISKSLLALLACMLLTLTGCSDEELDYNLKVPRLMLENRGLNYGNLNGESVTLPLSRTQISLQKDPAVSEFDIANIELVKVDLGLALLIQVSERGSRALYRASVTNNGGRIVLMINGNAIGARRIDGAIQDGKFFTFVELPDDDLEELVLDVKSTIAQIQADK